MKATKGFSVSDWCRNFEITFQGEQGTFLFAPGNFYKDQTHTFETITQRIVSLSRRRLGWRTTRVVRADMRRAVRFGKRTVRVVRRVAAGAGAPELQTTAATQVEALRVRRPYRGQVPLRVGARRFLSSVGARSIHQIIPRAGYRTPGTLQGNTTALVFVRRNKRKRKNQRISMLLSLYTVQYFEQDDPDLYLSKVKYILENDVEEMELYFVEEEYDKDGQLLKVVNC